MLKSLHLKYVIPFLLLLTLAFLLLTTKTAGFAKEPDTVTIGIILDLLITLPLLHLIIIWKTEIPKFTIIYPVLLALFLAGWIIPDQNQELLSKVKFFAIPLLELSILGIVFYKMFHLNRTMKNLGTGDFYDRVLLACQQIFPNRVGSLLATEISVFHYFFKPGPKKINTDLAYSYTKKSGIKMMIGVLLGIVIVETFVVHMLLFDKYPKLTWLLAILGIYAIMQVVAILRSTSRRFITIDRESKLLHLRYGMAAQTTIPFHMISKLEKNRRTPPDVSTHISLSPFELVESKNVLIELNGQNKLEKIYGFEINYQSISFHVDKVEDFVLQMQEHISSDNNSVFQS